MTIGPIQVIVFGFDDTDRFRGEVLEELSRLRGRGIIRLIDLLVALKQPGGSTIAAELDDLGGQEAVEAIKTAIAADVVRTLAMAELIKEAAVNEVFDTLATTELFEAEYIEAAEQMEAEKAAEEKEFFLIGDEVLTE